MPATSFPDRPAVPALLRHHALGPSHRAGTGYRDCDEASSFLAQHPAATTSAPDVAIPTPETVSPFLVPHSNISHVRQLLELRLQPSAFLFGVKSFVFSVFAFLSSFVFLIFFCPCPNRLRAFASSYKCFASDFSGQVSPLCYHPPRVRIAFNNLLMPSHSYQALRVDQ